MRLPQADAALTRGSWIVQRLPALDGVPVWDSMAFENETVFLGMEDRR
jgi:hypothetical protein